jgi:hypothetical protein
MAAGMRRTIVWPNEPVPPVTSVRFPAYMIGSSAA